MSLELEHSLHEAAAIIHSAHRVVVSSGAGISKESGVPTFRDAMTGLWERYDPERLATPQAFRANPPLVWSWYCYRRNLVNKAVPNAGHDAVVELEQLVAECVVLTQNVDGLHVRAGSRDVVELHGSLNSFKCFSGCRGEPTVIDIDHLGFSEESPPACPYCGDDIRPDVVWYGETLSPEALQRALDVTTSCDVMLVVGTSGLVQPAASLPLQAKRSGAAVIEVNPQPSGVTYAADIFLQGKSGMVLPALIQKIKLLRN